MRPPANGSPPDPAGIRRRADSHDYQLYLAINDIDHSRTKAKSPQTNGICERFHKTVLNEFYQITFRKRVYGDLETLQKDRMRIPLTE